MIKTCPVCQSQLFSDMDTCYNCMHHFESNVIQPSVVYEPAQTVATAPPVAIQSPAPVGAEVQPREEADSLDWEIRLEVVDRHNPNRRWVYELSEDSMKKMPL